MRSRTAPDGQPSQLSLGCLPCDQQANATLCGLPVPSPLLCQVRYEGVSGRWPLGRDERKVRGAARGAVAGHHMLTLMPSYVAPIRSMAARERVFRSSQPGMADLGDRRVNPAVLGPALDVQKSGRPDNVTGRARNHGERHGDHVRDFAVCVTACATTFAAGVAMTPAG